MIEDCLFEATERYESIKKTIMAEKEKEKKEKLL